MPKTTLYQSAHLIVSAIRLLEHRRNAPPSLEDVAELLGISVEETNHLARKMSEMGIVEVIENAGSVRLFVKDHRRIEEIPDQSEENRLAAELEKFKQARKEQVLDVDAVKAEQAEKKKKLHRELEQKLKENFKK
jgi:Mn-dependent DtxR family transcriptional regulator